MLQCRLYTRARPNQRLVSGMADNKGVVNPGCSQLTQVPLHEHFSIEFKGRLIDSKTLAPRLPKEWQSFVPPKPLGVRRCQAELVR